MTLATTEPVAFFDDERNCLMAVTSWIGRGKLDSSLGEIINAIAARRQTLSVEKHASFQTGDRVRCVRCKPQYMIGTTGTVVRKEDKMVIVQIDPAYRVRAKRFMDRRDYTVKFSASLIEAI